MTVEPDGRDLEQAAADYPGNYTKYLKQKEDRKAQLVAAYKNQREQIEHLEAFITRFRAQATKAKQVQSRIKELEKIERIEIPEEEAAIHFSFPQPPPSGKTVVTVENLVKNYGEKEVLGNGGRTPWGSLSSAGTGWRWWGRTGRASRR